MHHISGLKVLNQVSEIIFSDMIKEDFFLAKSPYSAATARPT